jgi:hypothetical protein
MSRLGKTPPNGALDLPRLAVPQNRLDCTSALFRPARRIPQSLARQVSASVRFALTALLMSLWLVGGEPVVASQAAQPAPSPAGAAQVVQPTGIWLSLHEQWIEEPASRFQQSSAPATVIRLCADGTFIMAHGILWKFPDSYGFEGHRPTRLFSGQWIASGSELTILYSLAWSAYLVVPDPDAGMDHSCKGEFSDATLSFEGLSFSRAPELLYPPVAGSLLCPGEVSATAGNR